MQCPVDGAQLVMTERNGVEIDYCPQCRGVWLDRGELDKIIDRTAFEAGPPPVLENPEPAPVAARAPAAPMREERRHTENRDRNDRDERKYSRGKRYKKKNRVADFLEDIFDF